MPQITQGVGCCQKKVVNISLLIVQLDVQILGTFLNPSDSDFSSGKTCYLSGMQAVNEIYMKLKKPNRQSFNLQSRSVSSNKRKFKPSEFLSQQLQQRELHAQAHSCVHLIKILFYESYPSEAEMSAFICA